MFIFPVKLTTSRIGNLTRLIDTSLCVMIIHAYGTACVEHLDHTRIIAVKVYGSSVAQYKSNIEGGCEACTGEPLAIYKLLNRNSGKAIVTGRGSSPTRTYSRPEATTDSLSRSRNSAFGRQTMRRWRVWLSMADEGSLYVSRSIRNRQEYGRATLGQLSLAGHELPSHGWK